MEIKFIKILIKISTFILFYFRIVVLVPILSLINLFNPFLCLLIPDDLYKAVIINNI